MSVSVDSQLNQVQVFRHNGYSEGFDASFGYPKLFDFQLNGISVDGSAVTAQPVNFQLSFDCCYMPTVVTPPVTQDGQTSYTYKIGDAALEIQLVTSESGAAPGQWKGDNSCCTILADHEDVSGNPPQGLFTFNILDNKMVVHSDDLTIAGTTTHTVTINPVPNQCTSSVQPVVFEVTVICASCDLQPPPEDPTCKILSSTSSSGSPQSTLDEQVYYVGSPEAAFDFLRAAEDVLVVEPSLEVCGPLEFSAVVYFDAKAAYPNGGKLTITEVSQVFRFSGRDSNPAEILVYTDDMRLLGLHRLQIEAWLVNESSVQSPTYLIPFSFERCMVKLTDTPAWSIESMTIEAGSTVSQVLQEPAFEHVVSSSGTSSGDCSYQWHSFSMVMDFAQGSQEGTGDIASFIVFNPQSLTITYLPKSLQTDTTIKVTVTAQLSDELTVAQASARATFLKFEGASKNENTAPYLVIPP